MSAAPVNDEQKKWVRNNATWCLKNRWDMNRHERIASRDLLPMEMYEKANQKYVRTGPVPTHPLWRAPSWIIVHATPALLVQMAWYHFYPEARWHPAVLGLFLILYFVGYLLLLVRNLHYWMKHYGVFDYENSGRDLPRDREVPGLARGIEMLIVGRIAGLILVGGYDPAVPCTFGITGAAITPATVVRMMMWFIVLDFFFYVYHRACHEVPMLWKIHALHHATRHPTPLQSILAGGVQEAIEVILIPMMSSMVIKMNTYELWMCLCVLIHVEASGHSGIRAYWGHPLLHVFLDPFKMGLCIEDHDLHHRYGKSGRCYGKQSLIWDTLFGTVGERIDCVPGNIIGK